jgi:putative aldouronate transport system permease protein
MVNILAKRKIKAQVSDKVFDGVVYFILTLGLFVVFYPLYFMCIASFSEPNALHQGRVIFLPKDITWLGYERIFSNTVILKSYLNSVLYTIAGVTVSLVLTLPTAFALSRPELPGRSMIIKLMIFTMYFYGGMVPLYIVVRNLKLLNSMWSLILPTAIVTYNLIVARSFYVAMIPSELFEASVIDGCNYTKFFFYIVLPLSKAVIAVMILFYATKMWNGFMDALIYLRNESKFPLQLVLRNILLQSQAMALLDDATAVAEQQKATELIKYGVVVVASFPMLCLYPFIQKYFVSGVMVGAVKG